MSEDKKAIEFKKVATKVSLVSIVGNAVLSVGKLIAGLVAHSNAMISDAVHSFSDVFSTVIVMIGIHFSSRKEDMEHPYGHERLECVAAVILADILVLTGLMIGITGFRTILSGQYGELAVPGTLALWAAVISILAKEVMFHYTKHYAKQIGSSALLADAWHHRSDALSSIGSFVGILFARLGYPVMDSVASVVICLFILKAAYDIFKDAMDRMVDKSCDEKYVEEIRETVLKEKGVEGIDTLRTRMFGNRVYVDLEIQADGNLTLNESHEIAERVHNRVEQCFENVKHIMIHVNPK